DVRWPERMRAGAVRGLTARRGAGSRQAERVPGLGPGQGLQRLGNRQIVDKRREDERAGGEELGVDPLSGARRLAEQGGIGLEVARGLLPGGCIRRREFGRRANQRRAAVLQHCPSIEPESVFGVHTLASSANWDRDRKKEKGP